MIEFISHVDFNLPNNKEYFAWLSSIVSEEDFTLGDLSIVFCSDDQLLELNVSYLNHNTLTDVITFDYTQNKSISGDVCISIERVKDNAQTYGTTFMSELSRVMAHGVLHLCGYKDKTASDKLTMRLKEDYYLSSLHLLR